VRDLAGRLALPLRAGATPGASAGGNLVVEVWPGRTPEESGNIGEETVRMDRERSKEGTPD